MIAQIAPQSIIDALDLVYCLHKAERDDFEEGCERNIAGLRVAQELYTPIEAASSFAMLGAALFPPALDKQGEALFDAVRQTACPNGACGRIGVEALRLIYSAIFRLHELITVEDYILAMYVATDSQTVVEDLLDELANICQKLLIMAASQIGITTDEVYARIMEALRQPPDS